MSTFKTMDSLRMINQFMSCIDTLRCQVYLETSWRAQQEDLAGRCFDGHQETVSQPTVLWVSLPWGKTLTNNTLKLSLVEIWHLVIIQINKPSDYDTYKECIA